MSEISAVLEERIFAELRLHPSGQSATELATALGVTFKAANECLRNTLAGKVQQGPDYRWRLIGIEASMPVRPDDSEVTEVARLSRYYLECIGQDMDEGVSTFASSRHGDPDYAQLAGLPLLATGSDWANGAGVARILGKVKQDRGKLVAWLGYPVRLRHHTTPKWDGFFVEPVLMWKVNLPEQGDESPTIDEDAPVPNAKFLRSMAMGDATQLAEEAARLIDELGLNVPIENLPAADELVARLESIRPDWDWREGLDPADCRGGPPLAMLDKAGIYNRAIVIPGERSPFTQGLETELKALAGATDAQLAITALGCWLSGETSAPPDAAEGGPLLEVMPMNLEQREAVRAAMTAKHTVITGPPGTGKSQVVTNLLVNAAWRGMKVLFASKNNKAVDVVDARVNGLGNRPVLLRLGSKEYQARLATYLSQMLAGKPSVDEQAGFEEDLERHKALSAKLADLDRTQQQTLDARNTADRLDAEAEEGRRLFGPLYADIDEALLLGLPSALSKLAEAIDGADVERQGFFPRMLWRWIGPGRLTQLAAACTSAAIPMNRLGVELPTSPSVSDLPMCRAVLESLDARLAAAKKIVAYEKAFEVLRRSPAFEDIAQERTRLTEELAQASIRLWREWVNLAPTRLSPAQRKDVADYAAALQLMTGPGAERVHASVRQRARVLQGKVTELFACWAVTSLSARGRVPLEPGFFDLVVIDEASQCDIASALPLLFRAKRSVIIGDPQQLRHISALTRQRDSELQHKHGLVDTRLGWMYSVSSLYDVAAGVVSPESIINLRDHHRSHADIIEFSNRAFYEGRLRVATRHQRLRRPRNKEPGIVWQDMRGDVFRPASGGALNRQEAQAIVSALKDLLVTRRYEGTVGVVTPFRAQAQVLQELVAASEELAAVRDKAELLVDTVHRFQGDERDVMLFSPVVSSNAPPGALDFLRSNGNLFNVAITRARGLLHVVGDRTAAADSGVDYLSDFAGYVAGLDGSAPNDTIVSAAPLGPEYPPVSRPERVSDWERVLYRAMYAAGLRPIPQYSVEQYDLDFALIVGERRLDIEVDGERHHRSWTGELCLRDQLRNQRLIELGWEVKRFWVCEVRDNIDGCIETIRRWSNAAST